MSGSRQSMALGPPPADLSKFPRSRLLPKDKLYRAHGAGRSPWWFSSNLSGRFDLPLPNGTCYLATDVLTALRERFGHSLVSQGVVTFDAAAGTEVSELGVPAVRFLANTCTSKAATFGMTTEIGSCSPYTLPQTWAAAFFAGRKHSGIRYQSRFSPGTKPNSVTLFDVAGQQNWPTDPHPRPGVQACTDVGITVVHPPNSGQVSIVQPPQ